MHPVILIEANRRYTEYLTEILSPHIYAGLQSIYTAAAETAKRSGQRRDVLRIFQKLLATIPTWPKHRIQTETERIRGVSGAASYLETMVREIIRGNIMVMTGATNMQSVIADAYLEQWKLDDLIHHCYVDCGRYAYNNPHLYLCAEFVDSMEARRNSTLVQDWILRRIPKTLVSMMPVPSLLKELAVNGVAEPEVEVHLQPREPSDSRPPRPRETPDALRRQISEMIRRDQGQCEEAKIRDILALSQSLQPEGRPGPAPAFSLRLPRRSPSTRSGPGRALEISMPEESHQPFEASQTRGSVHPSLVDQAVIEEYEI